MKEKIIKILERDETIQELLNEFMVDLKETYNKVDDKEKEEIKNFRDAIFRRWLNSPYINDTYVTPNYIINNIAQHNIKGDYSIIPHIKIKIDENNKINFETRWIYYSIDSLPVIEDIDLLVKHATPTLIVREENIFVVDNGEELIDRLNFRSGYYINYLVDISLKLGIVKEMKAIGCKVYQVTKEYDNFIKLDNKDKVNLIISKSIELTNNILKQSPYINDLFFKNKNENLALNLLDNSIDDNYYCKNIHLIAGEINDILKEVESFTDDKKIIEEFNTFNNIFEGDMATELIRQEVGIHIDMYFLSVFGYYLGIINYSYATFFIAEILVKLLLRAKDNIEKIALIFSLDVVHDLTPVGEVIVKNYKRKINKKALNNMYIDKDNMNLTIECHYIEKEDMISEMNNLFFYEKILDKGFNAFADNMITEVSKPILKHLEELYKYLRDVKGLKESTCEKSTDNIEMFIVDCLGLTTKKEIGLINEESVEYYLKSWFMEKVATSKNSIKEQISAIGQYTRFLESKKYITKETAKAIKNTIKDKNEYYNIFENLFNDLFN